MRIKNPLEAIFAALFLITIAFMGISSFQSRAKANQPPKPRSEAILVAFRPTMGAFTTNQYGFSRPQIGMEVDWCSPSSGFPQIPQGYPAGETVAYLINLGYQIQWVTWDRIVGVK